MEYDGHALGVMRRKEQSLRDSHGLGVTDTRGTQTYICCSGSIELFIGSGRRSYLMRGYATLNLSRK
jgi:hypothetical protein